MKVCSKCKIEKKKSEFSVKKAAKDGLRANCKACASIDGKRYHKENAIKRSLKGKARNKVISEMKKVIPTTKICGKCRIEKPSSEFNKNRSMIDGLQNNCSSCRRIQYMNDSDNICKKVRDRTKHYKKNPVPTPLSRVCRTCKIDKSSAEFDKCIGTKFNLSYQCKSCHKSHREKHQEKFSNWNKAYKKANRKRLTNYECRRNNQRRKTDSLFDLRCRIRSLISASLRNKGYSKNSRTHEILGCSYVDFKSHIESQFTEGMSWDNRHEWHIDHYYPVSKARDEAHLLSLNHFTNLRPMWALDNNLKGNKIPEEFLTVNS